LGQGNLPIEIFAIKIIRNCGNILVMSGHSKWANIKRKKEVTDAKKSRLFSKMSRLISVAAKSGADPDSNPTLRLAVERAKEARMPRENIERAIEKGSGQGGSVNFVEAVYEGFGPNGEAFYIKALTDNINRTVAEIRNIFSRHGGSLGAAGSTAYIFASDPDNPIYMVDVDDISAKKLGDLLDELDDHDDIQDIYVNFELPEK